MILLQICDDRVVQSVEFMGLVALIDLGHPKVIVSKNRIALKVKKISANKTGGIFPKLAQNERNHR